jgi:hypothetical protein
LMVAKHLSMYNVLAYQALIAKGDTLESAQRKGGKAKAAGQRELQIEQKAIVIRAARGLFQTGHDRRSIAAKISKRKGIPYKEGTIRKILKEDKSWRDS